MRRALLIIAIALTAAGAASAMPSQYNDDSDGWVGVYLFFSYPLGGGKPSGGLEVRGAGPENIGIDFQLMAGGITGLSFGATYFYNPAGSTRYTVPLTASLGYFLGNKGGFGSSADWDEKDAGIGLELSGGVDLYALGGVYDTEENESAYLELGARAATYLFGRGFHFAVEALAGGSWSLTPDTGGETYYYVY